MYFQGDNLGREWRIELKTSQFEGQVNFYRKRARQRANKYLVQKTVTHRETKVRARLRVYEQDPTWDDPRWTSFSLNVSPGTHIEQVRIPIQGKGQREKNKSALVTIRFQVRVTSAIRYVSDVRPNGWLRVKLERGRIHPLPHYLKVELIEGKERRDWFRILEGRLIGKIGSAKLKSNGESYLMEASDHKGPAKLIYDRRQKRMTIQGLASYNIEEEGSLLGKGTYDIEIPYEPHDLGTIYQRESPRSKTWFRIGHSGGQFIHTGRSSAGCLTVMELRKWTSLYRYLINRRKDTRSVGIVIIK